MSSCRLLSTWRYAMRAACGLVLLAWSLAAMAAPGESGIRFRCAVEQLPEIEFGMSAYLAELGIAPELVIKRSDAAQGVLLYTLDTPESDTDTLDLAERPQLAIHDDVIRMPNREGRERSVAIVSKKEILLALLQHGRLTELRGKACSVAALQEHVGVRQNIAAWAGRLNWIWPDGDSAQWNSAYWNRGTPQPGVPLQEALDDAFLNPEGYAFGCYTAAKMIVVQGVYDYYRRVSPDDARLQEVTRRLYADQDPLVDIEPAAMWDFEGNAEAAAQDHSGKLLRLLRGVAARNFVPGDWVYFLNTDPVSYQKTGYEGSNPIYLGRGKFSDYFNDHNHAYTLEQKLDQVYQWRNGVFSYSRHADKHVQLTDEELARLGHTPAQGGLLLDYRAQPYLFGFEE